MPQKPQSRPPTDTPASASTATRGATTLKHSFPKHIPPPVCSPSLSPGSLSPSLTAVQLTAPALRRVRIGCFLEIEIAQNLRVNVGEVVLAHGAKEAHLVPHCEPVEANRRVILAEDFRSRRKEHHVALPL